MIVRADDLRKMTVDDVTKKFNEIQAELIRQKGKKTAGGAPENPGRLKALRRAVARIITIQREMAVKAPEPKPAPKPAQGKPVEKKDAKPAAPALRPAQKPKAPIKGAKPAKKIEGKK